MGHGTQWESACWARTKFHPHKLSNAQGVILNVTTKKPSKLIINTQNLGKITMLYSVEVQRWRRNPNDSWYKQDLAQ